MSEEQSKLSRSISQRAEEIHKEKGFPNNGTVIAVCSILSTIEHNVLDQAIARAYNDIETRIDIVRLLGEVSPDMALHAAFLTLINFSMYDLGAENNEPSPERLAKLAEILQHGSKILQEGYQNYIAGKLNEEGGPCQLNTG